MINETKTHSPRRNFIASGENFFHLFVDYFTSEDGKKVSDLLRKQRRIKLKDSGHTYRVVNSWEESGLIDPKRDSAEGWRTFSIIDLFWMEIIARLRSFGISVDAIKKIKKSIKSFPFTSYSEIFEYYIALATTRKQDVVMVIYPDYTFDFATLEELHTSIRIGSVPHTFFCIGFGEMWKHINPQVAVGNLYSFYKPLSVDDLKLLEKIKSGGYSSIKIIFKDGKINFIELAALSTKITKDQLINNMHRILADGEYQTIEIAQQDGKVTHFSQTFKEKI